MVPVVIRGSWGELPGRPLRVLPGLRSPPFVCWAAAPPRRKQGRKLRGNAGVGSALAFAYLWDGSGSGFRTRTGGEKPAHRESGNAGNGSSRTLPSSFSLGEVGGDPLLLSPGWASCPVSSRNAAPLRPTRSRSRRAADQSPQRPHFNASRPPAQLVRFVASIPKAAEELRQPLLLAVCFGFRLDRASKLHLCAPH